MLAPARVEVKRGGICHVASGVIRHDGDVIAYLALVRPAFERIKRGAHGHVRRPGHAAISAIGIEQLRVGVIRSVPCVIPHRIDPPVGRYGKCAEPVPLAGIDWIVVDSNRRAEAGTAVGAAREHDVGPAAAKRLHARHHINVVVRWPPRTIHSDEYLTGKSSGIHRAAVNQAAVHVDCSDLVKCGRDIRVLRVRRSETPKRAATIAPTNKEVTVGGYIERSPLRGIRNTNRTLPCRPAIGRTAESPEIAGVDFGPKLILEPVTHACRSFVDGKPFLIAAVRSSVRGPLRPGLSAICGAPDVAAECVHEQAEIVKIPGFI